MKKKQIHKLFQFSKLIITVFAISALLVAGAFSFDMNIIDQAEVELDNQSNSVATFAPSPEEASESSEGVSTDKESSKKPSAQLFAVVAVFGGSDLTQKIGDDCYCEVDKHISIFEEPQARPLTNIWSLSDRLGRRFTLVGAKPSGTS